MLAEHVLLLWSLGLAARDAAPEMELLSLWTESPGKCLGRASGHTTVSQWSSFWT